MQAHREYTVHLVGGPADNRFFVVRSHASDIEAEGALYKRINPWQADYTAMRKPDNPSHHQETTQ